MAAPQERWLPVNENLGAMKAQLLGAGFPPLADDDVSGVQVPTLLMTGERSPAVLLRLTDRLQELLPNAQRVEIPGASHRDARGEPGRGQPGDHPFLHRVLSCRSPGRASGRRSKGSS